MTRSESRLADLAVALDAAVNTMELRERERNEARNEAASWEVTAADLGLALDEATAIIHALWEEELSYPTALWDRMCGFLKRHR